MASVLFQGIGATVASLDEGHIKNTLSYRGGLEFDITSDVTLYANVSTAFKVSASRSCWRPLPGSYAATVGH